MTGRRLAIGLATMGVVVPFVVLYLLRTLTPGAWLSVAAPCFFGWCIAEILSNILARPRLENRSPVAAIRDWDPAGDGSEPPPGQ